MRRALLLLALLGCGDHVHAAADAHADPVTCKADLEATLDRTCMQDSDCVLVDSADCCGTVKLGVRAGTTSGFPQAEAAYVDCLACGPRGCDHADEAEDGSVPGAGEAIVATCAAGRCVSVVR